MDIKHNLKIFVMAVAGMFAAAACSDDDNWQAGPQVKEGCQQVHFSGANSSLTILDDSNPDDRTARLTVERNTTEGRLSVPVTTVEADKGLEIPSEVVFEDGQQEATVDIRVTAQAEKGMSLSYSLQLTGDEIDPYADTDGGSSFAGMISFPKELTVKMWLVDDQGQSIDAAGYWYEPILEMGKGQYRFANLMESGWEVNIALDQNNRMTLSSPLWSEEAYNMYPNTYYPTDCYFYCNLWDDEAQAYVYYPFYPHGKDAYLWIEQMEIYTDSNPSNWYSYYYKNQQNEADSYFCLSLGSLKLSTEKSARGWQELRFRFLKDGEEPEGYLPEKPDTPEEPETPEEGKDVTFTAYFEEQYDTFGGTFEVSARQVGDNQFVFENFLYCGDDITLTIDPATNGVDFAGNYSSYWENYFYLTQSDGYAAYAYPNYTATSNYINYMYFYKDPEYSLWDSENKSLRLGTYFQINDNYDNTIWDSLILMLNE